MAVVGIVELLLVGPALRTERERGQPLPTGPPRRIGLSTSSPHDIARRPIRRPATDEVR
ncbi:hypothetical protein ACWDT6_03340 [Nocardia grenadensis]|uniref:hypothetical protein n=1 Tax=Nocardia grenadensis TaxID=931537 RepID=UPI0012ED414B|nr:hypothetical protein [Nocardia grenadensis]